MLIFGIYKSLNVFSYNINGSTNLIDLQSRININESYLNLFNFFWTNLTYLYLFSFVCLLLIFIVSLKAHKFNEVVALVLAILVYATELTTFLVINCNSSCLTFNSSSINLLLSNNLNKYHPFIFYISVYLTVILLILNNMGTVQTLLFKLSALSVESNSLLWRLFRWNVFALFLGSWWALQEGTWGGWWNWDASEVLGLLISLNALTNLHTNIWFTSEQQFYEKLYFYFLIILSVFFFIQLNFDLVSHNFGVSLFMFFSSNFFFLEVVCILIYCITNCFTKISIHRKSLLLFTVFNRKNLKLNIQNRSLLIMSLHFIINIIIINSFTPLINYFFWNYIQINSFNLTVNINLLITIMYLSLILVFNNVFFVNKLSLIIISIIDLNSLIITILFFSIISFRHTHLLHHSLILLISLNILSYNLNFTYFIQLLIWDNLYDDSWLSSNLVPSFICNNYFIEKVNMLTSFQGHQINFWNVFYRTNITTNNSSGLFFNTFKISTWIAVTSLWNSVLILNGNPILINELNACIVFLIIVLLNLTISNVQTLRTY